MTPAEFTQASNVTKIGIMSNTLTYIRSSSAEENAIIIELRKLLRELELKMLSNIDKKVFE